MAVSDVQRFLGQYGSMLNPYGQTAKDVDRVVRQNTTTPQLSLQYNTAPINLGMYNTLQDINPEVVNQLDFIQSPDVLTSTGRGLQNIMQGSQLLGTKLGEGTLGSKLFGQNFMKGPGASIGSPFTKNVSAGTFEPAVAGSEMTALQAGASNYFQNLKSGSVSAGIPTYLVGRALRSAFDDDDPTTFAAGEMLGAGVSGAGAASALMGLSPQLAALGPAGILLGIGISLFGGKRKRDKARKLQQEYEQQVAERNKEIMEQYREGITEGRADRESQFREMEYSRQASKFSNPYGAGRFDEGGLTGKEKSKIAKMGRRGDTELAHINKAEARLLKMLGGAGTINPKTGLREYHWSLSHAFDAIGSVVGAVGDAVGSAAGAATDIISGGIDAASDIGETALSAAADVGSTVGEAAADIADAAGVDDILEFANEEIISPVMDTAFDLTETAIEAGREVGSMAANFAGDIGNLAVSAATDVLGEFGEQVAFPVIDFAGDFVTGAGSSILNMFGVGGDDMSLPDLPPIPNIRPDEENITPNIVTIDPYGNTSPDRAFDASLASGSAGFVRPDAADVNNIYSQTQANV